MADTVHDIQFRELKDTIKQLNNTISILNQSLETANAHASAQDQMIANLNEQIEYLKKKLFGTSSECRNADIPNQLNLFDEAEQEADLSLIEEQETVIPEHIRKKKATNEERFKGIPVNDVYIELPAEEQICAQCSAELEVIGHEYIHSELEYIPAKVTLKKYYTTTYGCPECKQTEEPYIIKSEAPKPLIAHSPASSSTVAWTMYQKYGNALPLNRQEKDWKQYGYEASRTTLANWVIACSVKYLMPLYEYFHRLLLNRQFLMADETRIQVLNEPGRKAQTDSFMWLYRSGEDGLPVIILFGYTPTRAGYNAADFLSGFKGYLECDGYQGYNKVPDIKRCCCWAHVRRYFIDAVPKGRQYDYSSPAVQGVQFCNKLFEYEASFKKKNYSFEKIKEMRLEKEKPVLDAFWSWLEAQRPARNSRLYKAVNYVQNRREFLETYLEDGRCSFSNNLSENTIRPFTIGRKNWMFSDSQQGAMASAVTYSIVEMAKAHDLNIYKYLKYIFDHRPDLDMSDEDLEKFSPWNASVIEECKNN